MVQWGKAIMGSISGLEKHFSKRLQLVIYVPDVLPTNIYFKPHHLRVSKMISGYSGVCSKYRSPLYMNRRGFHL